MNRTIFKQYSHDLIKQIESLSIKRVEILVDALYECFMKNKQVFLVGNGGSGGNANHIANDFLYPVSKTVGVGLRAHSLVANPATICCLANDEGYENIFSSQLKVYGEQGDILISLSGSGNSENIIRCLDAAKDLGITSYSLVGFDGGKSLNKSDYVLHFDTQDMQVCEDMQMFVANAALKELYFRINGAE